MSKHKFDPDDFWEDSDFARKEYIDVPLTDEVLAAVERELGYTLPQAYVALSRQQNGGYPKRMHHRIGESTSGEDDYVGINGIHSIGFDKNYSLCGPFGSRFWIEEWGYPDIGVYFADCPSGGHDMLCLDYRDCGRDGEPRVVHIDQESDYRITHVADNFAAFVEGLEPIDAF